MDLKLAVKQLGGPGRVADICKVSPQAVRKWLQRGRLPRTEYTGETLHAHRMCDASGGAFTVEGLLGASTSETHHIASADTDTSA